MNGEDAWNSSGHIVGAEVVLAELEHWPTFHDGRVVTVTYSDDLLELEIHFIEYPEGVPGPFTRFAITLRWTSVATVDLLIREFWIYDSSFSFDSAKGLSTTIFVMADTGFDIKIVSEKLEVVGWSELPVDPNDPHPLWVSDRPNVRITKGS